ncbi:fibrosin-1-like protein [Lampris incognitus]|uniref:fibrosin-1-like protein n=1 Tax=Lampris incognitus TaxID=2546036 RepID=UPI0024B4AED6|nr:fibrosin-1-like protein [Lampris incognitus]
MDGKLKSSRRSRSKRERIRRREAGAKDARSPNPNSSCSDREQSPGRDAASLHGKKAPHSTAAARSSRPPRRKRRESSSQEEDIIDGFAITSFISLDCLEKTGVVKTQEKKERWKEKKAAKRQREEEEENVLPIMDPLENGFLNHAQREQERMNERLLKRTYSKKNKTIKPLVMRAVKVSEDQAMQELSIPHRSNSKEHLSESSTHSLSGHGYSGGNMFDCYSRLYYSLGCVLETISVPCFLGCYLLVVAEEMGPSSGDLSSSQGLLDKEPSAPLCAWVDAL